jgi:hypothetical protein
MKEGKCFRCRQGRHLAKDCPGTETEKKREEPQAPKKWKGKEAGAHIRALMAQMDEEEKEKLREDAEELGLGF